MSARTEFCETIALAAYADGELDENATALVDNHLQVCAGCRDKLRAHQALLCELDAVMTQSIAVPMPRNFSRVVTARATSDMGGVRSSAENRKALLFSVFLGVLGFSLLGASTRQFVFSSAQQLVGKVAGIADVLWTSAYDVVASALVISRVISRKFVYESGSVNLLVILLAFAIVLLSRLIFNYHRTRAVD
jgi:anti-sigma factor RsiW